MVTFAAHSFNGKRVAVFGLARSGISCALALMAGGAEVLAWDDSEQAVEMARDAHVPIVNLRQAEFSKIHGLVLSPGVPLTHPVPHWTVQKAQAANVEVIGDTEVFVRELPGSGAKLVAITGTNGKSTTTALVAHVLQSAGIDIAMGGNIGTAVLNLPPPRANLVYVVEFSSFQIDLTPSLRPDVAILTNITPDHLDRHGSMENYVLVKSRIFALQGPNDTALVGVDDGWGIHIADGIKPGIATRVSVERMLESGLSAPDGVLHDCRPDRPRIELDLRDMPALRGRHNWQNAAMAYGTATALSISVKEITKAMMGFPGLAHRMQQVATRGLVSFINDSKATNADAAAKALSSFENVYWIAGGIAKSGGIKSLLPFAKCIRHAYLIGDAANDFAQTLDGQVAHTISVTLERAVNAAAALATADGKPAVVLLSPACASFDHYKNFEIRGDAFVALVSKLDGIIINRRGVA
jgi:UDP-N-acetylmuramoylalanine--D-glutamate ligase